MTEDRLTDTPDLTAIVKPENSHARSIAETTARELGLGADAEIAVLAGGLTNDVYRATSPGHDIAVQVQMDAGRSAMLQINREAQLIATRHAAKIGIGPDVVHHRQDPPVLVTAFLKGRTVADSGLDPAVLKRAAASIAKLHASAFGPEWQPHVFDVPLRVREWLETSAPFYPQLAADIQTALKLAGEAEKALPPAVLVPCHNDLMPGNLLDDGETTWIIDWEFCGLNRAVHDLSNFIRLNDLNDEQADIFLDAYGALDARQRAAVTISRLPAQIVEAAYVLKCGTVGFLEMDHAAFFSESVALTAQLAASERYRSAMDLLSA